MLYKIQFTEQQVGIWVKEFIGWRFLHPFRTYSLCINEYSDGWHNYKPGTYYFADRGIHVI